jgi:hypothetical protein
MNAIAVSVHLGSEVAELMPALELSAVVECHEDELRRAINASLCRRASAERNEQGQ